MHLVSTSAGDLDLTRRVRVVVMFSSRRSRRVSRLLPSLGIETREKSTIREIDSRRNDTISAVTDRRIDERILEWNRAADWKGTYPPVR